MSKNITLKLNTNVSWDDATWILTSSFIIFTMQTGFSLLESGCVRRKNEVSIMMKNIVDPLFSGLAYWTVAYGLSYVNDPNYKNPYIGWGYFFVDSTATDMGQLFASYTFRLSLAVTATTIVSGATAERITFEAYCIFSFFCTIFFAIPSYWIWSPNGFLRQMKAVDFAGCTTIHLVGGVSGLVATIFLKPRVGRFAKSGEKFIMGSPTSALLGTFMLWWGWFGLNMGSTFGVSSHKWKYAARASISTICASATGGGNGLILSYIFLNRKFDIQIFICGLLSSLVSISAGCALYQPWESVLIGWIGSMISITTIPIFRLLKIDDPINTIAIHFSCSIWGMIAVSLIVERDTLLSLTFDQKGLFKGGSFEFLLTQIVSLISIGLWSAITTAILMFAISLMIRIRLSVTDEIRGSDIVEHNISRDSNDDTLLPQNTDYNSSFYAKRRLKRVMNALKASHRVSSFSKNRVIQRQIKENQTKTLSMSWPLQQSSAYPI